MKPSAPTIPTLQFRHRLRLAMEQANLDADTLAAELLASRSSVYGWLKGPHKPSSRKIDRIAEVTGVPAEWLRGPDSAADQASTGSPWIVSRSALLDELLPAA